MASVSYPTLPLQPYPAPAALESYCKLFALVLPVTSILLVPQIQGTTPGLVMALFSPFVVLAASGEANRNYWRGLLRFFAIFLFFLLASQLALLFGTLASRSDLILVRPGFLEPLRSTLLTQGLYLVSGCFTFLLFAHFYRREWDRFVVAGGVLLASIGLLEWLSFLLAGQTFDFLSNRTFGDGIEGSGSLTQKIGVMGQTLLRLKSLTGEPSMYSLSMLPYMAFCVATRRWRLAAYLSFTLLLSTSTSALLGFLVFGLLLVLFYARGVWSKLLSFLALLLSAVLFALLFRDLIVQMVLEKLLLENTSGEDRFLTFLGNIRFWLDSGTAVKLFGIGWGTVRSTDFFSTLLVNTGLVGLLGWLLLFLRPSMSVVREAPAPFILNLGMITVLIIMLFAVPEYAYLTTWMFLGILYKMSATAAHAGAGGAKGEPDVR